MSSVPERPLIRVGYGVRLARLAGRRRVHLIATIGPGFGFAPVWQADATVCGAPPPWDFAIESPWRHCRRCIAGQGAAFDAAPADARTLADTGSES